MPGPIPKSAITRQRRNKKSTAATLKAEGGELREVPPMPEEWHNMTKAWWEDVWRSPMADEFIEADKHGLYRLAVLVNEFWEHPSKDLHAEIRLGQQAFGLTPIDRRRLQWEVGRAESASRKKPPAKPRAGDDPRERLRLVQ